MFPGINCSHVSCELIKGLQGTINRQNFSVCSNQWQKVSVNNKLQPLG